MNFDVKVSKLKLAITPDRVIRKALLRAGAKAIDIIRDRTAQGKFLGGKWQNKPYSKEYWKFKQKNKHTDPTVNLSFSGEGTMMSTLNTRTVVTKNRKFVELYFSDVNANKKAFWNNQTRRFFDLTDRELANVQQVFKRYIDA